MSGLDVMTLMYWLLLGGVAVAAGLAPYLRGRRRAALAKLAKELGWQLKPDNDYSLRGYRRFHVFCRWPYGHGSNTLLGRVKVGKRTYAVQMGDYNSGSRTRPGTDAIRHLSYLLVMVPFPAMPDLEIRREALLDKAADAAGLDDIDFESDEFSRRYHVKSPQKRFAYDLVHPRMMEFLLRVDAPAVQIRDRLVLLTDGSSWKPEEFRRQLWWVQEFFELWPEHLVTELESRAADGGGAQ